MEQYIFTLDKQSHQEYLEYYVEKCQDIINTLFSEPNTNKVLGFVERNLRVVTSAMEKFSCMRLVGGKELPELTPNEEDSLVRAVVGLMHQYSEIFGGIPHLTTFDEIFNINKVNHNYLIKGLRDMIKGLDEIGACSNSILDRDSFHFYLSRLLAYADYLEINIETRTNVLYGIYIAEPKEIGLIGVNTNIDAEPTTCGGKVQAIVWTGDKLSIHPFITSHSVDYLNQFATMNKGKIAALCKMFYEKLDEMGPDVFEDLTDLYKETLRAVEADELLLEVAIALRAHENIRFSSLN